MASNLRRDGDVLHEQGYRQNYTGSRNPRYESARRGRSAKGDETIASSTAERSTFSLDNLQSGIFPGSVSHPHDCRRPVSSLHSVSERLESRFQTVSRKLPRGCVEMSTYYLLCLKLHSSSVWRFWLRTELRGRSNTCLIRRFPVLELRTGRLGRKIEEAAANSG